MKFRFAILLSGLAIADIAAAEPIYQLVTAAEAQDSETAVAKGLVEKSTVPKAVDVLAPRIEVVQPTMALPLINPFNVVVRFITQSDAQLDTKSLKVKYGFFRIDVTERMMAAAIWKGNEVTSNGAAAPKGKHRFYVQIADSKQRLRESEMVIIVR